MYRILIVAMSVCVSVAAQADAYGVFEMPGQTKTEVYYQDDDNIRISSGRQGYMLLSGGKLYSVINQGGKQVAMDMSQMGEAMARFSGGNSGADKEAAQDVEITNTGRNETVSGYQGVVHKVTVNGETLEVVLSDHPDVVAVTQGFLKAMMKAGQMLSSDKTGSTKKMLKDLDATGYGGILRQTSGLKLVKAEQVDKPDSFYQLPSGVEMISMPQ